MQALRRLWRRQAIVTATDLLQYRAGMIGLMLHGKLRCSCTPGYQSRTARQSD
jgi:hypothetical protein